MNEQLRGAAFPFRIDSESGGVAMSRGRDKVRENVRLILGTRHGERPMLRDFGSQVHTLVHELNDDVLADLVTRHAQQALLQWEPRIVLTDMLTEQSEGEIRLRLNYVHTSDLVPDDLVLPLR